MESSNKEASKNKKKAVKSKSKMNNGKGVAVEESGSVRKIRSFKRNRGYLPGESRRERRAQKVRDRAQASASASRGLALLRLNSEDSSIQGDDDTIYDGKAEDGSVSSQGLESSLKAKAPPNMMGLSQSEKVAVGDHGAFFSSDQLKKPYLPKLKVVLLLMDPQTHRFELLQLEFDLLKALVSDVLALIPISATEEILRKQAYSGVCGHAGQEMASDKLLANFCHGNDVVVAIPTGLSAKKCARLAKPILGDVKVGAMLLSRGSDARAWIDEPKANTIKKATINGEKEPKSIQKEKAAPPVEEKSSSNKASVFASVSVALLAILGPVQNAWKSNGKT